MKNKIKQLLESSNKVAITSHHSPDLDSLASVISIKKYIERYHPDIKSEILYEGNYDADKEYFPWYGEIKWIDNLNEEIKGFDTLILLDVNQRSRVTNEELTNEPETIICIDHHASEPEEFTYIYTDAEVSATSEIIATELFAEEDFDDSKIAEVLMYGLLGDTGNFRFIDSSNAKVLAVIQKLLEHGNLRTETLINNVETVDILTYEVIKVLVSNMVFTKQGDHQICYSTITEDDIKTIGCNDEQISKGYHQFMYEFLRNVEGYPWGFVVLPNPEMRGPGYRVSFRAKEGGVNVREIAEALGGGGHNAAAGGRVHADEANSIEEAVEKVLKTIEGMTLTPFN